MRTYDVLECFYDYLYETDRLSWPFLQFFDGKYEAAAFSYIERENEDGSGLIVYGINKKLCMRAGTVICEKTDLFWENESLIKISDKKPIAMEDFDQKLEDYCRALDRLINEPRDETARHEAVEIFKEMVSPMERELYKRACGDFLKMINVT